MPSLSRSCALLGALSLSATAFAQAAPPMAMLLDQPLSTEAVKLLPGYLGDDLELDALAVTDDDGSKSAVYLQAPASFTVTATIQSGIVDATVLRGATPTTREPIAVLSSSGLKTYRAPVGGQTPVELTALGTLTSWAGAPAVWSGTNQAGQPIVFGANANGSAILRAVWNGSGWNQLPAVLVPSASTQMLVYNHDGVGEVELAMLVGQTVFVLNWNTGSVVTWFQFGDNQGKLAVSKGTGATPNTRDLLVCYGHMWQPNGVGPLMIFALNSVAAAFVPAPAFVANDLQAFDYATGQTPAMQAIVLASQAGSEVQVLRRIDNAALFTPVTTSALVTGPSRPSAAIHRVCGGDFDCDGAGDLIAWHSPAGKATLHWVPGSPSISYRVGFELTGAGSTLAEPLLPSSSFLASITLPSVYFSNIAALRHPGETLYLEVVGWFRTSLSVPRDAVGEVLARVPLNGVAPDTVALNRTGNSVLVADEWSVDLRVRLVAEGPGYRRLMTVTPVLVCSNTEEAHGAGWDLEECMYGGTRSPGISGDRNLTGGTGGATTTPRRP